MSLGFRRNSTQTLTLAFGPNTNRTQTLSWSIGGIGDFKPEYSSGWFPEYIQGSGTAEGVKVIVDKMSYNISSATFSPEANIESSSYYNFSTDVESYYNLYLVIVEKSTNITVLSKRLYLSGGQYDYGWDDSGEEGGFLRYLSKVFTTNSYDMFIRNTATRYNANSSAHYPHFYGSLSGCIKIYIRFAAICSIPYCGAPTISIGNARQAQTGSGALSPNQVYFTIKDGYQLGYGDANDVWNTDTPRGYQVQRRSTTDGVNFSAWENVTLKTIDDWGSETNATVTQVAAGPGGKYIVIWKSSGGSGGGFFSTNALRSSGDELSTRGDDDFFEEDPFDPFDPSGDDPFDPFDPFDPGGSSDTMDFEEVQWVTTLRLYGFLSDASPNTPGGYYQYRARTLPYIGFNQNRESYLPYKVYVNGTKQLWGFTQYYANALQSVSEPWEVLCPWSETVTCQRVITILPPSSLQITPTNGRNTFLSWVPPDVSALSFNNTLDYYVKVQYTNSNNQSVSYFIFKGSTAASDSGRKYIEFTNQSNQANGIFSKLPNLSPPAYITFTVYAVFGTLVSDVSQSITFQFKGGGGIRYYDGSQWRECTVYYYHNGQWVECTPYYRTASNWVECG